jgi:signal transduction histidine kinase
MVADKWFWSDIVCEIVGVPPGTLNSREGYMKHVHRSDVHLLDENRERCFAGQPAFDLEYRIVRPDDDSIRWLASNGRVDLDANGNPLRARGVLQDVTARKLAELARDELRRQLMQAQEQERLRLAQELHDQTGQGLAVALMSLKGLESDNAELRRDQLRALREQLEQMGQTLNRVAWELRPAAIDELGLTVVLADYVAEWGRQFGIKAEFDCRDGRLNGLADDIRTTIYRVVQEALTNIAKHAKGATAVSVVINRVAGVLRLTIEDNGPGLVRAAAEPNTSPRKGGLGLAGMRERLALIGGLFEIETTPYGVTIFARIPLEPARLSA